MGPQIPPPRLEFHSRGPPRPYYPVLFHLHIPSLSEGMVVKLFWTVVVVVEVGLIVGIVGVIIFLGTVRLL